MFQTHCWLSTVFFHRVFASEICFRFGFRETLEIIFWISLTQVYLVLKCLFYVFIYHFDFFIIIWKVARRMSPSSFSLRLFFSHWNLTFYIDYYFFGSAKKHWENVQTLVLSVTSIGLAAGVSDVGASSRLEVAEIDASSGGSTGSEVEMKVFKYYK